MKNSVVLAILLFVMGVFCTKTEHESSQSIAEKPEEAEVSERIFIDIDISSLEVSKVGDEVPVSLDDGSSYSFLIERKEQVMPGITNISALVNDKETGQATLVFRDGKLAGSVNMFSNGINYKLGYLEESGQHFIVPVDPTEKDVLPGGEPLNTPGRNG